MINPKDITISKAALNDYPILKEIYFTVRNEQFFWLSPHNINLSDFDSATQGELILSLKVKGQHAGFISIWEQDNFIHNLFILKEFRGMGLGKKLIEEAVKRHGLPLSLKCIKANEKALNFYLSQGWKIQEENTCQEGAYYLMKYDR